MKQWLRNAVVLAGMLCVTASASAQVVFNYGPLQAYLDAIDPGIDVANGQHWSNGGWFPPLTGNTEFTMTLKRGSGMAAAVGITHHDPVLYQVFPPNAVAGWYAAINFGGIPSGQDLTVSLFDENNNFQGQTVYANANVRDFGFYVQGPCGTWFSNPLLNHPQGYQSVLYASHAVLGDYWLCFEACLYDPATSTFDGVVLSIQSVSPTPAASVTWGQVKGLYR